MRPDIYPVLVRTWREFSQTRGQKHEVRETQEKRKRKKENNENKQPWEFLNKRIPFFCVKKRIYIAVYTKKAKIDTLNLYQGLTTGKIPKQDRNVIAIFQTYFV